MKEGLCEANPVMATNDPTEGMTARDRVLADNEFAPSGMLARTTTLAIIKLLLLTGCRREEIGALKWSEIEPA